MSIRTHRYALPAALTVLLVAAYLAATGGGAEPHDRAVDTHAAARGPARAHWFEPNAPARTAGAGFGMDGAAALVPHPLVYGRHGRAIDFQGQSAAQYIGRRMAAARTGNIQAAYEVYLAESVCANNDTALAEYQDPLERERFLQERESAKNLCDGVTPAQLQERMVFLAQAARAGNADAQIDFYTEGPYGRQIEIAENDTDLIVKQWKIDAMHHLSAAAGRCDPFALGLLAAAYDAGVIAERAPKMVMVYNAAASAARNRALTREKLSEQYGDQMSAADFDDAVRMAGEISHAACDGRPAPVYP